MAKIIPNKDIEVERLIQQGATEEGAYYAAYGMSKERVDMLRRSGRVGNAKVPNPNTAEIVAEENGQAIAEGEGFDINKIRDQYRKTFEMPKEVQESLVPYRNAGGTTNLQADAWLQYGGAAASQADMISKISLVSADSAVELRDKIKRWENMQQFLTVYGGRTTGLLWPLIGMFDVAAGKGRGESWSTALARFNPTWIDPDTSEKTTAMAVWRDSWDNTAKDLWNNFTDDFVENAITGLVGGFSGGGIVNFNNAPMRIREGESREQAQSVTELHDQTMVTGFDLLRAWRAGHGIFAWGEMAPGTEIPPPPGVEEIPDSPLTMRYDPDNVVGGPLNFDVTISDDPEIRAQQIEAINAHTDNYYRSVIERWGQKAGLFARAGDQVGGLILDLVWDPMIPSMEIPVATVNILRRIAPKGAHARVLGAIARRSQDPGDVLDYLSKAEDAYENAKNVVLNKGAGPQNINIRRREHAKKMLIEAKAMADEALRSDPFEAIVVDALKRKGAKKAGREAEDIPLVDAPQKKDPIYSDIIDTKLLTVEGAEPERVRAALLTAIRHNINQGAKAGAPENVLRGWENVYDAVKAAPEENLPEVVTRFGFGEESFPMDWEGVRRALYANDRARTAVHVGEVSEVDAIDKVAMGNYEMEWQAEPIIDMLNGRPVDDVLAPEIGIPTFAHAHSLSPHAVTPDGMIDMRKVSKQTNKYLNKINKQRKKRINQLRSKTKGYKLDEDGSLLTPPRRDAQGRFVKRKRSEAEVKRMLEELRDLEAIEPHKPVKYDYDIAGQNPIKAQFDDFKGNWKDSIDKFWVRGLYPEAGWIRSWGYLTGIYRIREPGRGIRAIYPKLWRRIRQGTRNKDLEFQRAMIMFKGALAESGAYQLTKKGQLTMVDKGRNELLYQLLNHAEDSDEYAALIQTADAEMRNAARKMRQAFDFYAKKQGIYNSDLYIEGYISWMNDMFNNTGFMHELRRHPTYNVHARHLFERGGQGDPEYTHDVAAIADMYAAAMSRKMHLEPLLIDMDNMAREFARVNKAQGHYLMAEINRVNSLLTGKPSVLGHIVDSMAVKISDTLSRKTGLNLTYTPGAIGRGLMGLTNMAYAAQLTGTRHYFPMALVTGMATTGGEFGFHSTIKSLAYAASPDGQALAQAAGIGKQFKKIMEEGGLARMSDWLSEVRVLAPSISDSEAYIRGITFHAAAENLALKAGFPSVHHAIKAGKGNRILSEAFRIAEETNHMFGVLGKPTIFSRLSRSFGTFATQFMSFMPKQTEQLVAMGLRNPGYFARYMMFSGYLSRVAATELGIDITSYTGLGYLPNDLSQTRSMGMELLGNSIDYIWNYGQVLSGAGDPVELQRSGEVWLSNFKGFAPMLRASTQAVHGLAAVVDAFGAGEVELYKEYLNDLNTKWDRNGHLVRQYNVKFPTIGDRTETMNSDFFALVTGMRSLQDTMDQEKREIARELRNQRNLAALRASITIQEAVHTGDWNQVSELAERLAALGYEFNYDSMIEAEFLAQTLEETLRNAMDLTDVDTARYLEMAE